MAVVSGKALWSIICGQSVLASDEVVGKELQEAASHLRDGLSFFKPWNEEDHRVWASKSKLPKQQLDFIFKVGELLELCSEQAWQIFQLFLKFEYKGSLSQLHTATSSDREETLLLHQVFNFYLTDPLHLLSCRRHIIGADSSHPYQNLFKEFISTVLDEDHSLGSKLVKQLEILKAKESSILKTPVSNYLPANAINAKIAHYLSAIRHQIATLLIYHGSPGRPCSPQSLVTLLRLAQGSGLGRVFVDNERRIDRSTFTSQLEAIDAFHSFLLTLAINVDLDPSLHPLCVPKMIDKINPLIFSLGSKPWHYPPLLAWAMLQGRRIANEGGEAEDSAKYSRLAQRAIKGNALQYLQTAMKLNAFETDHLLLVMGASVTYSLLCIIGTCLDLEKLSLTAETNELAKHCLAFGPPSFLFWNEVGGGASILLPSALEFFPYNSPILLEMATSLASASQFSSQKVVELLKDLESFTWPLVGIDPLCIGVSSSQVISRENIEFLPGFIVPKGCHGFIVNGSLLSPPLVVSWQLHTNGWQLILSIFEALHIQLQKESVTCIEKWQQETVICSLRLMSAILRNNPKHLPLFIHLQEVAHRLLKSVSRILRPQYDMVASLLEFFSELSKIGCTDVWGSLDGNNWLLPSLNVTKTGKEFKDLLMSYQAGSIRALICGEEAVGGSFLVLRHLCTLVEEALKIGLGPNSSAARGSLVFVIKEVFPVMLLWRYASLTERVCVMEGTLSLLHHSLEEGCVDRELQEFIVYELTTVVGGGGNTLRAVLEGGATLEATLDEPAEWPHSLHTSKLTRIAQLALSLTHRLVSHYMFQRKECDIKLSQCFLSGFLGPEKSTEPHLSNWTGPQPPHLALTVAQFVRHRLNPRLPYLALRTLARMAKEFGVPLVACFGSDGEGLRDCLLSRLDSSTEDLWVKVALLRLLTTSTHFQPGLIRLFITPPGPLLDCIVRLLHLHKEGSNEASSELLAALVELVASLWERNILTAKSHLREMDSFWKGLEFYLNSKLPGSIKDELVGNIFRIYSFEFFGSKIEVCDSLKRTIDAFIDPKKESFNTWFKYIFVELVAKKASVKESEEDDSLLKSSCEFLAVFLSRSKVSLTYEQKRLLGEMVMEGLISIFDSGTSTDSLQSLLAEANLVLIHHCGKVIVESEKYVMLLTRLMGSLRSSVMQTKASCQLLILAGAARAIMCISSEKLNADVAAAIVSDAINLVEQHCSLAALVSESLEDRKLFYLCSSPSVLGISCAFLHQCLLVLPSCKVKLLFEQSQVIYSLMQVASRDIQDGNTSVVREVLQLLCLLRRKLRCTNELNTHNLSLTVSLALSSLREINFEILCDLLWCTFWCLKYEGAEGVEGAVNIAAVHLACMTSALASSDTQPDLALASASLAASLAEHHLLWRVLHSQCFEELIGATASCIHRTIRMLHVKETLEREEEKSDTLITRLLQVLSTCLQTILLLSPSIVDLLCSPGLDLGAWSSSWIQPNCRKLSSEYPGTLPNLSTFAEILDLYHILLKEEGRLQSQQVVGSSSCVSLPYLTYCAEVALILVISYSAFLLMSPELQPREARDIRTFLADETNSFFSHWMGKRLVVASSPPSTNLPFVSLSQQLVTSLCNSSKC